MVRRWGQASEEGAEKEGKRARGGRSQPSAGGNGVGSNGNGAAEPMDEVKAAREKHLAQVLLVLHEFLATNQHELVTKV